MDADGPEAPAADTRMAATGIGIKPDAAAVDLRGVYTPLGRG